MNGVKLSIGIPVYNGEKFLHKKLDSLLEQTFTNFEIIISDNASTDLTAKICEEYAKKDKRICYFRQNKNMGAWWNFGFVLEKAKYEYFLWSAVDDILLPQFLEENVKKLESDKKIACSVSKMRLYGKTTNELEIRSNDSIFKNKIKKFKKTFGHLDTFPATGSYEKRVKEYIKNLRHNQIFYGVFRTDQIRQAYVKDSFLWNEGCIMLNILKFGELFVVDKVLMNVYDEGMSRKGMFGVAKQMHHGLITTILPMYPFTKWCGKNLGSVFIMKNLGFFIKINCIGEISIIVDLMRKIKSIGSK
ncbi:glycosyltransferase family 2 protein [Nitrosarchaeum koreense]|uniref:Glycosyl transferase family 2 n=1 Tax=Nitrosarchaeum koreense MY1 TaxID=1001994 RepID=F9CY97_9ARCH|nr:glycosyltransferase family 2 protein [Nitrosarchaeum koreense]EGP92875.1 Glycosyl transferase family 2 [Nitrosarchaeum koreense MY1]